MSENRFEIFSPTVKSAFINIRCMEINYLMLCVINSCPRSSSVTLTALKITIKHLSQLSVYSGIDVHIRKPDMW